MRHDLARHGRAASRRSRRATQWDDMVRELQTDVADEVTQAFVAVEQGARAIRAEVVDAARTRSTSRSAALGSRRSTSSTSPTCGRARRSTTDASGAQERRSRPALTGVRGRAGRRDDVRDDGQFLPAAAATLLAANPVLLGAGALFGGMQLVEDRKRKVAQRRQTPVAGAPVPRRRAVRGRQRDRGPSSARSQRELRDEFTDRLGELQRTYTEAAKRAQEDAKRTQEERQASAPTEIDQLVGARPHARAARSEAASMNATATAGAMAHAPTAVRRRRRTSTLAATSKRLARARRSRPRPRRSVERLDGPLRVAIAGRVKAGKSTLLNALVGERLAPTDAGECTRIVSLVPPRARATRSRPDLPSGEQRSRSVPAATTAPSTSSSAAAPSATSPPLDVRWPASTLDQITLIDTPGLASLNDENSRRTRDFLEHDERRTRRDADAVIYLMRHLHRPTSSSSTRSWTASVAGRVAGQRGRRAVARRRDRRRPARRHGVGRPHRRSATSNDRAGASRCARRSCRSPACWPRPA